MAADSEHCIVMTTCGSEDAAASLAGALVEQRLAACVQVVQVASYYTWEGRVADDREWLLLIKTHESRYAEVESFIAERHDYELPEVVRVPIQGGSAGYLAWIDQCTAARAGRGE